MPRNRTINAFALLALAVTALVAAPAPAQVNNNNNNGGPIINPVASVAGVYLDTTGRVSARQVDETRELEQMRARARNAAAVAKDEKLCYVSLPRLLAEVRAAAEAGTPLTDAQRYLGGMTQLRYVLVYPDDHDLVIAGPAEPIDATNPLGAVGKRSGRPVLQLDDLVVAMRQAEQARGGRGAAFGCSIDPAPDAFQKSNDVMRQHANSSRQVRMDAMAAAIGPQRVTFFNAPTDTRLAFVCVAADYKMKRLVLGLDPSPVLGVASPIDNSRAAGNRFWFETHYEPLLVSADGAAFELRGPRLKLQARAFSFDAKGATPRSAAFAKAVTDKLPALAAAIPLFADLQNVADLSMLATLIRADGLDRKAGWDRAWLLDARGGHKVATVPVPQTADTLVSFRNGSIAAGGVSLNIAPAVDKSARVTDDKDALAVPRQQLVKLRTERSAAAIVTAP